MQGSACFRLAFYGLAQLRSESSLMDVCFCDSQDCCRVTGLGGSNPLCPLNARKCLLQIGILWACPITLRNRLQQVPDSAMPGRASLGCPETEDSGQAAEGLALPKANRPTIMGCGSRKD